MPKITPPFYPIIYIRGYAMTQSAIEETVATPYMGFNLGSTKIRQEWDGEVKRHIFESPLIRLMKDYGYVDNYTEGSESENEIPAKSVVIHRYYEQADHDIGTGDGTPTIEEAAQKLNDLILNVREQVCGADIEAKPAFKVYLVAHSMGGLIARCLLQNDEIGTTEAKNLVDKVFTYGTPHNGIEMRGANVPRFLGIWDIKNFNRKRIAEFLNLPSHNQVNTLNGKFRESRFFCLVGTNHKDYNLSRIAVGPMSDGLVKIENASIQKAPRVYTHHSHSGHYGMVNSEEGYQNLTRFLFGNIMAKGVLHVDHLPLPPSVRKAKEEGKKIRASYFFESTVTPRASRFKLSERRTETHSAVFRKFDEMFPDNEKNVRMPILFSVFLDTNKISSGRTIVFTIDITVKTTEYRIDGNIFTRKRIPEENIFRDNITVRATPVEPGNLKSWNIRYNLSDEEWGENRGHEADVKNGNVYIPLKSKKGFAGKLKIEMKEVQPT
ncbi:MAG: hypothetical protein WDZ38_03635 [Balneolaceae bacterium]